MRHYRLALIALLFALGSAASARAEPITQIVVFGDNLSDTGNVFAGTGTPPAPYHAGRYSNGPVWVEHLATKLGVAGPTPSLLGGTNYAFGGAESGTGTSAKGTPNVRDQVGLYLASHAPAPNQLF